MKIKKRTVGITTASAAIIAAGATAITLTQSDGVEYNLSYEIKQQNEYVSELLINAPDELSIDFCELYLNGEAVDITTLPNGKFTSVPLMFSDLSNLSIKLYKLGDEIGIATFDGGELKAEVSE